MIVVASAPKSYMKMHSVQGSSNVKSIGYSVKNGELGVRFKKGPRYIYSDVPAHEYRSLMAAPSKGKYLYENIKGYYPYIKESYTPDSDFSSLKEYRQMIKQVTTGGDAVPSVSQKQQRYFGYLYAKSKSGNTDELNKKDQKIVKAMGIDKLKDYASTKRKDLLATMDKHSSFVGNTLGTLLWPLGGYGLGLTLKNIYEDRNILKTDDVENSTKNKLLKHAPATGLALGVAASPAYRGLIRRLTKTSSMRDEVNLMQHQQDAVDYILQNRRGILAHATGLGKTLSSIAAYEKLKEEGKAKKALVIVPASLRDNYVDNIKRFTNSSYDVYGAKNEGSTLNIDQDSKKDYSIISYDLYRKDPRGIKERSGADTLIIDEVHRSRNEDSNTFAELSQNSGEYNNVITLTGSVVNNTPSDISPLIDVTYGSGNNPIGNKKMFDKMFVRREEKVHGFFNPKTDTHQKIINKPQLKKLLEDKVHYLSHDSLESMLPQKKEEIVRVTMTPEQERIYEYTLDALDPKTRAKIRNNIPVSQREMAGLFGKIIRGRQVMTDPAAMYEPYKDKSPYEYSPKVKRVVDDLQEHLNESSRNKAVIYGNLIGSQVNTVGKVLDEKGIPYSTFLGTGNEGNTAKARKESLSRYMKGDNRVLLISAAGGEGLDLKGTTMMQMLEGHYNPEKIQQAEARVRRAGDKRDTPIEIKKYVSVVKPRGLNRLLSPLGVKPVTSIDEYIYTIAKRKNDLNQEFRDVLGKSAGIEDSVVNHAIDYAVVSTGQGIGNVINKALKNRDKLGIDAAIKQKMHDINKSEYANKKHYNNIKRMTRVDERELMIGVGSGLMGTAAGMSLAPIVKRIVPKHPLYRVPATVLAAAGVTYGLEKLPLELLRRQIMKTDDVEKAVGAYEDKLRKRVDRKVRNSTQYLSEYDRAQQLGLDRIILET